MNQGAGLPHISFLEHLPLKQNLDNFLNITLGKPFYGDGPINSSPIISAIFIFLLIIFLAIGARQLLFSGHKKSLNLIPAEKVTIPNILLSMMEFFFDFMCTIMGRKNTEQFFPLIGSLGLFILASNMIGLIPGLESPTSNLNVTLACALVIFFTTHVVGVKQQGVQYVRHFFGPITAWYALPLMLLFFIIEVIAHIARPISLSMRLFGNMFADHAMVAIFVSLVPILVPIPIILLGFFTAILQTLVFCIISMIYISMAIEEDEPALEGAV